MPTAIQQNWNNKEVVVTSNELIVFFKQADNPWTGAFFPIELVANSVIKYIVKKPMETVTKVTDKSARIDVDYIDTETNTQNITNMYTSGQKILEVDLGADNGQDLQATAQFEVSNNLVKKIASDDILAIGTYAQVVEITEDKPIANLTAMLKAQDVLFQLGNLVNAKYHMTNSYYDKIVYLANNKGIITDNNIAQQLRLDGSKLFVKGIECVVVRDEYMIFGADNEVIPFVLVTPRAMKRYYLQSMSIYVSPVNDGKVPKMILIGGEVTSEALPYMTKSETTSRWMVRGKYKAPTPPTE